MVRRGTSSDDFDSPWKLALHRYLKAFLALLFPDIHADLDWARGYETLDKEFQQIVRRSGVGKQVADMLFKVWLRDGAECWLLVHIEVQNAYDKDFARRMFNYNTAAYRLYNREVVSLAVLGDEQRNWRPTSFGYGRWGSHTTLTFPIVKLLDYADKVEALEASDNPFAVVVLAHLQAQATRGAVDQRFAWKFRLVKGLFERNLSREEIRELLLLIDWFLALPATLEDRFRDELHRYEQETKVPYIPSYERASRAEGHAAGLREGLLEGVAIALEAKFGAAGRKLLSKVKKVTDVANLRRLAGVIQAAESLDEVRQHLP